MIINNDNVKDVLQTIDPFHEYYNYNDLCFSCSDVLRYIAADRTTIDLENKLYEAGFDFDKWDKDETLTDFGEIEFDEPHFIEFYNHWLKKQK